MFDSKPVALPAHLWEALDTMSSEMGVGRDALVSQAVFTLARLNGYVVPGRGLHAAASAPSGIAAAQHTPAPAPAAPPGLKPAPAAAKPAPAPPPKPAPAPAPAPVGRKPAPAPEPEPEPEPEDDANPFDQPDADASEDFGDDVQAEDDLPQEEDPPPDDDLPAEDDALPEEDELPPEEEPAPAPPPPRPGPAGKQSLTLVMANREPHKMTTDVVTIGRGKSCEFVIESNRVSREHARIIREAGGFVLEDLNSSNGTFFGPNKEKVTRRPIRDGDEFTFGTEKVKFQIRK
jgi:hypothetical protein